MVSCQWKSFSKGTFMTIEEMIRRKTELGYTNEMISEFSGVPLGTVQKIFGGVTKAPRYETIRALENVLGGSLVKYPDPAPDGFFVNEPVAYRVDGSAGRFTVKDYYNIPDDKRVELIDGFFYDMAAPSAAHQIIVLRLWNILDECIRKHDCNCRALASPFDVQVNRDDKTMVQPDVIIFCGMENVRKNKYYGAPEFVAEVLSPSTRRKDMFIKLNKYRDSGVKEYWVIDPKYKVVTVYDLENDLPVEKYSFSDRIPVRISEGKCEVDFSLIDKEAEPYYDLEEE